MYAMSRKNGRKCIFAQVKSSVVFTFTTCLCIKYTKNWTTMLRELPFFVHSTVHANRGLKFVSQQKKWPTTSQQAQRTPENILFAQFKISVVLFALTACFSDKDTINWTATLTEIPCWYILQCMQIHVGCSTYNVAINNLMNMFRFFFRDVTDLQVSVWRRRSD